MENPNRRRSVKLEYTHYLRFGPSLPTTGLASLRQKFAFILYITEFGSQLNTYCMSSSISRSSDELLAFLEDISSLNFRVYRVTIIRLTPPARTLEYGAAIRTLQTSLKHNSCTTMRCFICLSIDRSKN